MEVLGIIVSILSFCSHCFRILIQYIRFAFRCRRSHFMHGVITVLHNQHTRIPNIMFENENWRTFARCSR